VKRNPQTLRDSATCTVESERGKNRSEITVRKNRAEKTVRKKPCGKNRAEKTVRALKLH
jgi:hypothetical protein